MARKNPRGLRRYPRPGKYEGGLFIDPYVDEGVYDEEIGEAEFDNWYGILRGDLAEGALSAAKEDGEELTKEEVEFLENQAGAIISENSQGFVTVKYYADEEALEEDWQVLVDEVEGEEIEEEF